MKLVPLIILTALLAGCASHPKPVKIDSPEGTMTEIDKQQERFDQAMDAHVHVLAPTEFDKARDFIVEAREQQDEKESSDKIYESLGIAQAYLQKANARAQIRAQQLPEVLAAREAAIKAEASLTNGDEELKRYTAEADDFKDMTPQIKDKIRKEYLLSELNTIKEKHLGEVKRTILEAENKGAKRLVPRAYNDAKTKYDAAETAIELNRHAEPHFRPEVKAAAASATQALSLTDTARMTQKQTPEERARTLQAQNKALQRAGNLNAEAIEANREKADLLAAQGAALGAVAGENEELRQSEMADQAVADAAEQFDESEAQVYRQGDRLIIRLKKVNFPSGRADLPTQSMPLLTKVKTVIQNLNPQSVTVEGHTDAVGPASINQKLSEARATSVARYFESDEAFSNTEFETAGFGYSKPLTSNKTKEGRAQNRRVDIVITPGRSI